MPDETIIELDEKVIENETENKPEPKQSEADKRQSKYDAIQTANVIARQSPEVIQATLDSLARKIPAEYYEDLETEKKKPEPAQPDHEPTASDAMAEIAALKRQNWTSEAVMKFKLAPEHRKFISGSNEREINASAAAFAEALEDRIAEALKAATPPDKGDNPPPGEKKKADIANERPPEYKTRIPGIGLTPEEGNALLDQMEADGTLADLASRKYQ